MGLDEDLKAAVLLRVEELQARADLASARMPHETFAEVVDALAAVRKEIEFMGLIGPAGAVQRLLDEVEGRIQAWEIPT